MALPIEAVLLEAYIEHRKLLADKVGLLLHLANQHDDETQVQQSEDAVRALEAQSILPVLEQIKNQNS